MSPRKRTCAALIISAPASNQGKTVITAGLVALHRQRGKHVRVFKCGPDFIDPTILSHASAQPAEQLDFWMMGVDACRRRLWEAAADTDLIIIEGAMGLFDGFSPTSSIATTFGIAVVVIINAESMAQTFQAIARGLATADPTITFAGVLANKVGSPRHANMLWQRHLSGVQFLGSVFRNDSLSLPRRHLGLVQAEEIAHLQSTIDACAEMLATTSLPGLLPVTEFDEPSHSDESNGLQGKTIAIASDSAFSFIYQDNLHVLQEMGADLVFFSPLTDNSLPPADAVYLPGGYPELHMDTLSSNIAMQQSLVQFAQDGRPIYAECGGMLYLLTSLTDMHGNSARMCGLLPGNATVHKRFANLGYQRLRLGAAELRGHTFHNSTAAIDLDPIAQCEDPAGNAMGEFVFQHGSLTATYMHTYFRSQPQLITRILHGEPLLEKTTA